MKLLVLTLVLATALSLTGCGRRGAPSPPGPAADVIYPHDYPSD
jgi:predicted small lipoprotein YifL